ncbi:MAG: hypothetical protein QME40_05900 [bacterium]|nr:hypothetical protein [bacterium]
MSRYLFFDDGIIDEKKGVFRECHRPIKSEHNPILKPSLPWETEIVYLYGTVSRDKRTQEFRMWYDAQGEEGITICYASSVDGINWERPLLGIIEYLGSRDNNIVLKSEGFGNLLTPSVLIIPGEDKSSDERYRLIYWEDSRKGRSGGCVAFSKDGLNWRKYSGNPVFCEPNDVLNCIYDERHGRFVCFQTLLLHNPSFYYPQDNLPGMKRVISIRESEDSINWSEQEKIIEPDSLDPPDLQFYGMSGFNYEDIYLGFLWTYHTEPQTSDIELIFSRDCRNWERVNKNEPFISLGEPGSFDSHLIYTPNQPIIKKGEELLIYYSGWDGPHNSSRRKAAIGLARLRTDGFLSYRALSSGFILTTPILFEGRSLFVNVDAENGALWVEMLNPSGEVIKGFKKEDCREITSNSTRELVRWKNDGLERLMGKRIRLRFYLKEARLFSFWFE